MKKILLVLVLLCSVSGVALAGASGSYQNSCNSCSDDGTTLTCDCMNESGQFMQSSINYSNCAYPISNCETQLTCGNCNGYNVPFVCGTSSTYPACFSWNDPCYNCSNCFQSRRWCSNADAVRAKAAAVKKK